MSSVWYLYDYIDIINLNSQTKSQSSLFFSNCLFLLLTLESVFVPLIDSDFLGGDVVVDGQAGGVVAFDWYLSHLVYADLFDDVG